MYAKPIEYSPVTVTHLASSATLKAATVHCAMASTLDLNTLSGSGSVVSTMIAPADRNVDSKAIYVWILSPLTSSGLRTQPFFEMTDVETQLSARTSTPAAAVIRLICAINAEPLTRRACS